MSSLGIGFLGSVCVAAAARMLVGTKIWSFDAIEGAQTYIAVGVGSSYIFSFLHSASVNAYCI